MSTRTNEKIVHHDVMGAFLTQAPPMGLGWVSGVATQVTPDGLVRPESLLRFLKTGNASNTQAWQNLKQKEGGDAKAEQVALKEVQQAIQEAQSMVLLWREGIKIQGFHFDLWNAPPARGTLHSQSQDFLKNEWITVPELPITGCGTVPEPLAYARVRNDPKTLQEFKSTKQDANRRVDQTFFVNGLLYSMIEVKARQTNQKASQEGRAKLADDFRTFAFGALQVVRHEFELSEGRKWPGLSASRLVLDPKWQTRILSLLGAYAKTPWLATLDMNDVWLAPEPLEWLVLCDASLSRMLSGDLGKSMQHHPQVNMDPDLNKQMLKGFSRMPDVSGTSGAWDQVKVHLSSLLSFKSVAREIALWHHLVVNKNKKDIVGKSLFRPRLPQRVAIDQTLKYVEEYYQHEHDAGWLEKDLRDRLALSLPALSETQVNKVISDRLKYRNGHDAYSVLIQGAAGLGKTHIAVCLAISLYNMLAPRVPSSASNAPSTPLFDRIVILTDRVELRQNIADEAHRSGSSRGQILDVKDKDTLTAALTGAPVSGVGSGSILVVNLQKFPSLMSDIKEGRIEVKHQVGRTAFIIDEIHRSQSGDLNEAATQSFVNNISNFSASASHKKNIVIGLTATPTDPILARFGQWRPGVVSSDETRWVPHFAYAMKQAVEDGYVFDPMKGLVKLSVSLEILTTETLENVGDATSVSIPSDVLYEDRDRQRKVAEKFAEIFVTTTMLAMPHSNQAASTGRGKAMITVPSIRAAITMVEHVREALLRLGNNAKGKPWEAYAETVKNVANERVFVLYSKSTTGQGKDLGVCGRYNPQVGNAMPTEKQIIDGFRCKGAGQNTKAKNSIIVVVDKLLTGFDESTLHTLLIARSMQGVALFQAMCRINRVADGKTGCLVLDASHGDQVSKEAHRVFAKFGSLSTSDLNGLDLLERLKERRKRLLLWPNLKQAWRGKRVLTDKEIAEDRHAWVEQVQKDPQKATELRRMIGGYLTDQQLAKNLMHVEREDLQEDWLDFLREIHNLLRMGEDGEKAVVSFKVGEIGLDDILIEEITSPPNKEPTMDTLDVLLNDLINIDAQGALVDQIDRLRMTEEERAQRRASLQKFIDELFLRMDRCSQSKNNDEFRRILQDLNNPLPHHDVLTKFKNLFDSATGRDWIGKDPEKVRYRDLIRPRLEVLLGDYRLR